MYRYAVAAFCAALMSLDVSAQISIGGSGPQTFRVQGTIGIGNGESTVTLANPNAVGDFLFLFPALTPLKSGEHIPLRLHAVGHDGRTVLVWKADDTVRSSQEVVAGGGTSSITSAQHFSTSIDIPAMLSGTSQIVRIDIPGIKAGSAISVSPSEELPGMLAIAHASAPVDCVVIVKLINPGPFTPGMTMPFSIGAGGK
jgi:hypothetical protein